MHSDAELVLVIEDSPEIIEFLVSTVLPDRGYQTALRRGTSLPNNTLM
jgi:hypothetical protein